MFRRCLFASLRQVSSLFRTNSGTAVDGVSPSNKPQRTSSGTIYRSWQNSGGGRVRHRSQSLPTGEEAEQAASAAAQAHWRMRTHEKALCEVYPRTEAKPVKRFPVPQNKVPWSVDFPEYKPVDYTADSVLKLPPWADVDFRDTVSNVQQGSAPIWNALDGRINRRSHMGKYEMDGAVPRNPVGRTGMKGRGLLGRWGPNHAADPIVTRWKRNSNGAIAKDKEGKPILEFIAVQRRDNGQWAIPGGMVDANEVVTMTLRREFGEEALNSLEASKKEKKQMEESINELFANGAEVYRGYVDDPRNTDNAWMETVAMNFHDNEGTGVARFKLHAGDDAVGVQWMELGKSLELYASHTDFLRTTAAKLDASW